MELKLVISEVWKRIGADKYLDIKEAPVIIYLSHQGG